MMNVFQISLAGIAALVFSVAARADVDPGADPASWRAVPASELIVMETSKGQVLIEMFPELAPQHVARIKEIVRSGAYDRVLFHRVADINGDGGWVAQGGDVSTGAIVPDQPAGTGGTGVNIPGEFEILVEGEPPFTEIADEGRFRLGVKNGVAVRMEDLACYWQTRGVMGYEAAYCPPDGVHTPALWAPHCPGVVSMARGTALNSADSQFFLVRGEIPHLDREYSVWGRIVSGMNAVEAISAGDCSGELICSFPADLMTKVRLSSDIEATSRPAAYVAREGGPVYEALISELKAGKERPLAPCDVFVPSYVVEPDGTITAAAAPNQTD